MGELVTVDIGSRDAIGDLAQGLQPYDPSAEDSRADLERKVEERTRELEKVNREMRRWTRQSEFMGLLLTTENPRDGAQSSYYWIFFILSEKGGMIPDYMKSYLQTIQR